jgi:hypothetical protein
MDLFLDTQMSIFQNTIHTITQDITTFNERRTLLHPEVDLSSLGCCTLCGQNKLSWKERYTFFLLNQGLICRQHDLEKTDCRSRPLGYWPLAPTVIQLLFPFWASTKAPPIGLPLPTLPTLNVRNVSNVGKSVKNDINMSLCPPPKHTFMTMSASADVHDFLLKSSPPHLADVGDM